MKRLYTSILSLILMSGLLQLAKAQCTADPSCTDLICPGTVAGIPQAQVGTAYSTTFTFNVPSDTTIMGQTGTITSINLSPISNLPTSLTQSCSPVSCSFTGGSTGCVEISGTPVYADRGTRTITVSGNILLNVPLVGTVNFPFSEQYSLTIACSSTADAGTYSGQCISSGETISLSGSVPYTSAGTWSGGLGTYSSTTALGATYEPTQAEITAGTVVLTLTPTVTNCTAIPDVATISLGDEPTVSAGNDQTICSTSNASLSGSSSNAPGVMWSSSGDGNFTGGGTSISDTYSPGATDISSGTATLTLTTTGVSAPCTNVSSNMTLTVNVRNGIDDELSPLKIYPNPSNGDFTIDLPNTGGTYEVVNNVGIVVASGDLEDDQTDVSISNLVAGYYTVKVSSNEGAYSKKIIID